MFLCLVHSKLFFSGCHCRPRTGYFLASTVLMYTCWGTQQRNGRGGGDTEQTQRWLHHVSAAILESFCGPPHIPLLSPISTHPQMGQGPSVRDHY